MTTQRNTWVHRKRRNSTNRRVVAIAPCKLFVHLFSLVLFALPQCVEGTQRLSTATFVSLVRYYSMGHLEAFARRSADKYSELKVHQGIHLSY